MRRLLLSAAVLAAVALSPGLIWAQMLGVTVCGKTVGIGVSPSPVGVGYGYGYRYGAAPGAGLCCGTGFGMPGYGVAQYGLPSYGYNYGATYGTSCHGSYGVGYGTQNYGTSCHGGAGYGSGAQ